MANANILLNKCPLDTGARSVLFSQIFGSHPRSLPNDRPTYIYIYIYIYNIYILLKEFGLVKPPR